jgi:hypothetical protein
VIVVPEVVDVRGYLLDRPDGRILLGKTRGRRKDDGCGRGGDATDDGSLETSHWPTSTPVRAASHEGGASDAPL